MELGPERKLFWESTIYNVLILEMNDHEPDEETKTLVGNHNVYRIQNPLKTKVDVVCFAL